MNILNRVKDSVAKFGVEKQSGFWFQIIRIVASFITGYNHSKYWRRRQYVINPQKRNVLWKMYCLLYIKRVDAKHLSSIGTFYNSGAKFSTPPYCHMV
jgi:hypothetical protein